MDWRVALSWADAVDSDDSLLIAAKGKIQDVKKVAEQIKARESVQS